MGSAFAQPFAGLREYPNSGNRLANFMSDAGCNLSKRRKPVRLLKLFA